jgi:hypothetical protein
MNQDKCVNKRLWILKTDYKRQTTVLSVIFVLVGMMLVVPAMTEKAHASILASAISHVGSFSDVRGHMYAGEFLPGHEPRSITPYQIIWGTHGRCSPPRCFPPIPSGGDERGYVAARVGPTLASVEFHFSNPAKGSNTCGFAPSIYLVTCSITQGVRATAKYDVNFHTGSRLPDGGDANSADEDDNSDDTP